MANYGIKRKTGTHPFGRVGEVNSNALTLKADLWEFSGCFCYCLSGSFTNVQGRMLIFRVFFLHFKHMHLSWEKLNGFSNFCYFDPI